MDNEILSMISEQESKADKESRQALIIQPGAIGDCILTLPLAGVIKSSLDLGRLTLLSRTEYTGFLPGRSCVDAVRSLESIQLHRLFHEPANLKLDEHDSLLTAFMPYQWIISFMGEPGGTFEQNLIFTVHCTHSADVITLKFKPPADYGHHITQFYLDQLAASETLMHGPAFNLDHVWINPTHSDRVTGLAMLERCGLTDPDRTVVIGPGAGGETKCWPINNFFNLALKLRKSKYAPVFLLGPAEAQRSEGLTADLAAMGVPCLHDLSLSQVASLFSCCRGFIGNDSGLSHIAGSCGVRTVAIFGPTSASLYRPMGPLVATIQFDPESFESVSGESVERVMNVFENL
jgi:heptosyltransferase-3